MMQHYIRRGRGRRSWLTVCVVIALGATVTTLVIWMPSSGWLLTMHMAMRHALSWFHNHWLNAPAITAGATILLVIVSLVVPLYIWRRDRASSSVRPGEEARDIESGGRPAREDDSSKAQVVGDTVANGYKRNQSNEESASAAEDRKLAKGAKRLDPPFSGPPATKGDLIGLADEKVQLLYDSVAELQDLLEALAQVRRAAPHPVQFAESAARLRLSLESVRHQLLALRNGVNFGNWADGGWALMFTNALQEAESNLAAFERHAATTNYHVAPNQDGQLRRSVDHLLCVLKEKYPSLFAN
jgi:hypothetical protein